MGKNRNNNRQPQGTTMSVQDPSKEDQAIQAAGDSVTNSLVSNAIEEVRVENEKLNQTSTDDTVDKEDPATGDESGDKEDAGDLDGTEEQINDTSAQSLAPQVVDLGTSVALSTAAIAEIIPDPLSTVLTSVQTEAKPTVAAVQDVGVTVSDTSDLAKLLNQVNETGTVQQKALIINLNKYMQEMAPGKPTLAAAGAQQQMRLWEIMRTVVENPDPSEFRKQMFIIRAFFKRYGKEKSALHDHYINRFAESWTRSTAQLAAMQRLINVFKLTADPVTTQEELKSVDLARSLAVYFSEQHRQRVIAYFQQ